MPEDKSYHDKRLARRLEDPDYLAEFEHAMRENRSRDIGLGRPQPALIGVSHEVHILVWDISEAPMPIPCLGVARFSPTEARAFAAKLISAADESEKR